MVDEEAASCKQAYVSHSKDDAKPSRTFLYVAISIATCVLDRTACRVQTTRHPTTAAHSETEHGRIEAWGMETRTCELPYYLYICITHTHGWCLYRPGKRVVAL